MLFQFGGWQDYWEEVLSRIQDGVGFSPRLLLDIFRIRRTIGILTRGDDYLAMAKLSIESGYPDEARQVLDEGFRRHLLGGPSPQGVEYRRIREALSVQARDDELQPRQSHGRHDGEVLAGLGFALALEGRSERAIAFLEHAIVQSGLRFPDDVRFRLGLAQLWAGRRSDAEKTLRGIRADDGTKELARLWLLIAKHAK